jgi:hypothetical protein
MNETILGKRKDKSDAAKTPPQPLAAENRINIEPETEKDGMNSLDQLPLDLTGIMGSAFSAAKDVNINSPALLDVLTEKQQGPPRKKVVLDHPQPLPRDETVAPKASEWEEW